MKIYNKEIEKEDKSGIIVLVIVFIVGWISVTIGQYYNWRLLKICGWGTLVLVLFYAWMIGKKWKIKYGEEKEDDNNNLQRE